MATIFKPSPSMARRAYVKPPVKPSLPIGTPLPGQAPNSQPNVNIPEPATLVGDLSGKPYVNLGDNPNGDETFSVTPPGGTPQSMQVGPEGQDEGFWDMVARIHRQGGSARPIAPPKASKGATSMALGGAGQIGPDLTPADFNYTPSGSSQQMSVPGVNSPAVVQPPAAYQQTATGPAQQQYQLQNDVYSNQQAANDAKAREIAARNNVYTTQQATYPAQYGYIDAQGRAVAASDVQNQGTRQLITQSEADVQARKAEEQKLQASASNVGDLTAVARAKQVRADAESRDQRFDGLTAPQEVAVPPGFQGKLPAGVLAKLETQNEEQTREFSNADKLRSIDLESAKHVVDLLSTDSVAAENAAKRAGFTLDLAKQKVAEAENAAGIAGLGVDTANMNTSRATVSLAQAKNLPPGYDIYEDPNTGNSELVTTAQKAALTARDQRQTKLDQAPADQQLQTDLQLAQNQRDIASGAGTGALKYKGMTPSQLYAAAGVNLISQSDLVTELVRRYNAGEPGGLPLSQARIEAATVWNSGLSAAAGNGFSSSTR